LAATRINVHSFKDEKQARLEHCQHNIPSLSAPAKPRITHTGCVTQYCCSSIKNASFRLSS